MTTPAPWTDALLRIMARLNLVSSAEIHEHKSLFDRASLLGTLAKAGFGEEDMRGGYFELGLNVCCRMKLTLTPCPKRQHET